MDFYLLDEERRKLISDYVKLKGSIDATAKQLPKSSRYLFQRVRKAVFRTARMMHGELQVSQILDVRRLRQQIEALNDPELLQQLSSYEENSLKPSLSTSSIGAERLESSLTLPSQMSASPPQHLQTRSSGSSSPGRTTTSQTSTLTKSTSAYGM